MGSKQDNMLDFLIPMLFGWPMISLSLGFTFAGILLKRRVFSLVGAVLFLPPAWYLSLYSAFSLTLPLLLFSSTYAVSKEKFALAFLLIVPVLIVTGWLGILVLTQ